MRLQGIVVPAGPGQVTWLVVDESYETANACSPEHTHASGTCRYLVDATQADINEAYARADDRIRAVIERLTPWARRRPVDRHLGACARQIPLRTTW